MNSSKTYPISINRKRKRSFPILSYAVIKNMPLIYTLDKEIIKRYLVKEWIELMRYLEKENYLKLLIKNPLDDYFYVVYLYRKLRISLCKNILNFYTETINSTNIKEINEENIHSNKFINFSIVLPLDELPIYISDSEEIIRLIVKWRLEYNI